MASQARKIPKLKGASLPPASARSTAPERTIQKAWPIAWVDDAQATPGDLDALTVPDERDWEEQRKPYLIY
jgi:hypothetical protein